MISPFKLFLCCRVSLRYRGMCLMTRLIICYLSQFVFIFCYLNTEDLSCQGSSKCNLSVCRQYRHLGLSQYNLNTLLPNAKRLVEFTAINKSLIIQPVRESLKPVVDFFKYFTIGLSIKKLVPGQYDINSLLVYTLQTLCLFVTVHQLIGYDIFTVESCSVYELLERF